MESEVQNNRHIIIRVLSRAKNYFTVFLILVTLLAYVAVFISPDVFQFPQYVGMAYPFILAVDVVYAIVLAVIKRKAAIIMAALVLIGFGYIRNTVQLKPTAYFDSNDYANHDDSSFNVMSFNVRLLDRYNWIKGKTDTRQKIFEFLQFVIKQGDGKQKRLVANILLENIHAGKNLPQTFGLVEKSVKYISRPVKKELIAAAEDLLSRIDGEELARTKEFLGILTKNKD